MILIKQLMIRIEYFHILFLDFSSVTVCSSLQPPFLRISGDGGQEAKQEIDLVDTSGHPVNLEWSNRMWN